MGALRHLYCSRENSHCMEYRSKHNRWRHFINVTVADDNLGKVTLHQGKDSSSKLIYALVFNCFR